MSPRVETGAVAGEQTAALARWLVHLESPGIVAQVLPSDESAADER